MSYPDQPDQLTLNMVSYEWLDKTNNPKMLKRALKLLKDDGNFFPDLSRAIDEKLQTIDLKYKKLKETESVSKEDIEKAKEEILQFENEYRKKDNLIKETLEKKNESNYDVIKLERKKEAQNEKIKGNELMKTKEYDEAIRHYTKAINYDEYEPTIYCNRALAYIKNTSYNNALEDCNKAIDLKHDYIKAYYRRAICEKFLKKFKESLEDFLYVYNDNPNSNDVLNEINNMIDKWKDYDKDSYLKEEKKIKIKLNRAKEGKYFGDGNITVQEDKNKGIDSFTKVQIVEGNVDDNNDKKNNNNKENSNVKVTDIVDEKKEEDNKKSGFKKIQIVEEDD
jgi:tetratricopeptide (TPR) repeat protein